MQEEQEQEIHLRDYLKVIVKRRYSILTVSLLIIVVASIGIFSKTPVYRATTRILIDKESANIVNLRDPYYEGYYSEEYYNTQMELIQSTAVAYKVVKNLNLDKPTETPQPTGKTGGGVLSGFWDLFGFNNKGKKAEAKLDDVGLALAKMVQGGLSVEPIKNSRLVNLSYVHADPVLAAKFANAYADAYLDQVLEIKMGTTRHAVDWMTKKLDEQKIRMEESQKALQEYIKNKDFLTIGDKEAVTSPKIQSLSSQLMAAETRRRETEVLYNQVKALSDNPRDAMTMPGMTEDPVIQSLRDEEIKAEKQLMELSKKYGDRHPLIIKAKGDIRSLREKMDSEIKRVIASRKNEYELAKANEANLRVLFERGKGEAQSLTAKSMQFDVLKHEVEMNEQIYEALLKRVKETTLVEEVKSFNIYVLDKAEIPKSPINPNSFKNFLLAIMLGLSGGVGLAFFLEYLDNTFKGPEDIEEKLALPLLGIVPRIKKADAQDRPIESLVLTDPKSAVGESYKALRTSVLLSSGDPVKSFVVTSSVENEGKTTT
ncbi:MAG TPA: exopolysaccharide transport family protein, partial [Thermodesulfovibrionales bacterium]|nr:exopolysaccharide transport family protein [Thermodesulfovibrionales bacterium]